MPPIEDLEAPLPSLVDECGSELQDVIIQNLGSIRTHTSHGPVQSRYNFNLMTSDTVGLELGHIFTDQTTAFKLNISYGFILRNRTSGRYRYYHSSCNCCGRYLDEPSLITNADTFENFLERINEPDILKWALSQRPNSDWVVEIVTNATIFVNLPATPHRLRRNSAATIRQIEQGPNSFGERSPQQTLRRQSLSVPLSRTASRPRSKGALCQVHRPTS